MVNNTFNAIFGKCHNFDIIAFTDGAAQILNGQNNGPSGSGAVVLFTKNDNNNKNVYKKRKVLGIATNNISELYAIWMAIELILNNYEKYKFVINKNIRFFTDSEYVIKMLNGINVIKENSELITWIRNELYIFEQNGWNISMHWVGGHAGIKYNEMADELAVQARKESEALCFGKNKNKIFINT